MRSLRLLAPPSCCLHRMARLVRILLLYWACQEGGHHFPATSEQLAPSSNSSLLSFAARAAHWEEGTARN